MNYSNIKYYDIANGEGIRCSLFCSGCRLHCKGCFNYTAWDFNSGKPFTQDVEDTIIKFLQQPEIKGLTLLGGEPFEPENISRLVQLVKRVKAECPNKDIWAWSGNTFETLMAQNSKDVFETFKNIDVLVDGKFIEELKDITLKWRGSKNQRVIDMKKTMKSGVVTLYCD